MKGLALICVTLGVTGAAAQQKFLRQRMIRRVWRTAIACLVTLVIWSAFPQESSAETPGWEVEFTPYLWVPGLSGNAGVGNSPRAPVDAGFGGDTNADLGLFGLMGAFEARRGHWALLLDGIYVRLSSDNVLQNVLFKRIEAVTKIGIANPALAYRLWENELLSFDVTAGARIWMVDIDMTFSEGALPPAQFSATRVWADPVVGARLHAWLGKRWFATALGDVGGFGVSSELTWQAFAGVGYQFNETWSVKVGYRALAVDYKPSGFEFDVIAHGPLIGIGIRF